MVPARHEEVEEEEEEEEEEEKEVEVEEKYAIHQLFKLHYLLMQELSSSIFHSHPGYFRWKLVEPLTALSFPGCS